MRLHLDKRRRRHDKDTRQDDPGLYDEGDRDSFETDIARQEDMYGELYSDLDDEEDLYEEEEDMYEDLDEDGLDQSEKDELDEETDVADDPNPIRRHY